MRFVLSVVVFLSLNASAKTYYIDDLVIETSSSSSSYGCVSGGRHSILVTGSIGPDSTFAVGKLIDQREPCTDASGDVIWPIEVILESGGGYLEDGYKLGKVFRDRGVTTIIPDNKMCASSCAVAFLGGKKRVVAGNGSILFHAPYLKQMQLRGKDRITCDMPKEELQALNDYYSSMTSVEVGDRLFERTMWYCSDKNGWTIKGAAAAELYGIATDIWDQDSKKISTDYVPYSKKISTDYVPSVSKTKASETIADCVLANARKTRLMSWIHDYNTTRVEDMIFEIQDSAQELRNQMLKLGKYEDAEHLNAIVGCGGL